MARDHGIGVAMTRDEYEELTSFARKCGISPPAFLRRLSSVYMKISRVPPNLFGESALKSIQEKKPARPVKKPPPPPVRA